jgi:hypothetical protein
VALGSSASFDAALTGPVVQSLLHMTQQLSLDLGYRA